MSMSLDEFVAAAVKESGKTVYTFEDAKELTERWIDYKTQAAAAFPGWKSDADIDALLFGMPAEEVRQV
jgi:hypothetical protein